MAPNRLVLLHISDLHFGHGDRHTGFDQQGVVRAIVRTAKSDVEKVGRPTRVLITGDVASRADPEVEYPAASRWLEELADAVDAPLDRFLIVPGNHDVRRAAVGQSPETRVIHEHLRQKPAGLDELLGIDEGSEHLWSKFEPFAEFCERKGVRKISKAEPFWVESEATDIGPVNYVGLNTALLCSDEDDEVGTLALGLKQLDRCIDGQPDHALMVVLAHHPPAWLRDGARLEGMLSRRPHLLCCGHDHEPRAKVVSQPGGRSVVELRAGPGHARAAGPGGSQRDHAYQWIVLDDEGLTLFPLRYTSDGDFRPDSYACPLQDDRVRVPPENLGEALVSWLSRNSRSPRVRQTPAKSVKANSRVSGPDLASVDRIQLRVTAGQGLPARPGDRTYFYLFAGGLLAAEALLEKPGQWELSDSMFSRLLSRFPLGRTDPRVDLGLLESLSTRWPPDDLVRRDLVDLLFRYQDEEARLNLHSVVLDLGGRLDDQKNGDRLAFLWVPCAVNLASRLEHLAERQKIVELIERVLEPFDLPLADACLCHARRAVLDLAGARDATDRLATAPLPQRSGHLKLLAVLDRLEGELRRAARFNQRMAEFEAQLAAIIRQPMRDRFPMLEECLEDHTPVGQEHARRLVRFSSRRAPQIVGLVGDLLEQRGHASLRRAAEEVVSLARVDLDQKGVSEDYQAHAKVYGAQASWVLGRRWAHSRYVTARKGPTSDDYVERMLNNFWTPELVWLDMCDDHEPWIEWNGT